MISQAVRNSQKPQLPQLSRSFRVSPDLRSLAKAEKHNVVCTAHTRKLIDAGDEVRSFRPLKR